MGENIKLEQERLNHVMEIIKEQILENERKAGKLRKEVIDIRRNFWDDVKVNIDTFDDYLETIIGLRQQAQLLTVSQSTHRHAYNRLAALRRMEENPYFGRIDFKEDGADSAEHVYIGVSTLTDKSGDDILVYDWRAPISSVYYDYAPGRAEYETPEGIIRGSLEEKWQYIIRDGSIQSMFNTSITIGDEILKEVLGKGTDKYMRSIVATIQKEQNRIIRHDRSRLLVVHGAAGSGKTSAALQRIAYLLYKYRGSLNAEQIILFSPNEMFNSYVSNVLPELGEENMQQTTFQEYLWHRLSGDFDVEGPYEQLEYVLTREDDPNYRDRLAGIRFKASQEFYKVIRAYGESLAESGMIFKSIQFMGRPLITAEQIEEQFYGSHRSLRFHNRLELLVQWLNTKLDEAEKQERQKPWVREEIELLSNEQYEKIYARFRKQGASEEWFNNYENVAKALGKIIVRKRFKPIRNYIRKLRFIDMKGIYEQLFREPEKIKDWTDEAVPAGWADICRLSLEMLGTGQLFYEDATPFLFLKEMVEGFQTNTSIKHVVVDEAQDYSPFQYEFLKRLFPRAKMTILGDFNQAIYAHAGDRTNFQMLNGLYGTDEMELINLKNSYRSTKQIVEFTRSIIPEGSEIIPFERNGQKPSLRLVADREELHERIVSKVAKLRQQEYETISIICKSAAESSVAFNGLKSIAGIKLVKDGAKEYEKGVIVIPAYLAKGIEFDAVIIYDASAKNYGDETLRRMFYTACTRAMHELQLYSIGEPSPFLADVGQDLLVFENK